MLLNKFSLYTRLFPFLIGIAVAGVATGAAAGEPKAHVLAVEGSVAVDGKLIHGNPAISAGSTIETSGGKLTLSTGTDNVMKIAPESRLRLETLANGQLNGVLEKGRVEGIRRIDAENSRGSTRVGTRAGTFEITGGRYLVEVPKEASGAVQFLAVDGNAQVTNGDGAAASIGSNAIALQAGDLLRLSAGEPGRMPAAVTSAPQMLSASELGAAYHATDDLRAPRTPQELAVASGQNIPARVPLPMVPSAAVPVNALNRDPLQPVRTPASSSVPRVQVTFTY